MRVLLDATAIPRDRGGVGRYVDGLVQALGRTNIDLVLACQHRDADMFARSAPDATVLPAPWQVEHTAARLGWEQVGLPRIIGRSRAQVVHAPHYTQPLIATVPVVVTFHDATFFSHPQLHSRTKGAFFRRWTRISADRAARVIVPSRATRDELARRAGVDLGKVDVAYHGVDLKIFRPPDPGDVVALRARLGLGERPYVAFLGTIEPRKNVPNLVRAFATLSNGSSHSPVLVLAGGPGWDDETEHIIAGLPASVSVVRAGYLPLDELAPFLGGAAVVAYPSLGEGFGLPVLEAMACGSTVLTTRSLALPEVGGDAVAYTEPDASSISSSLRRLLDDDAAREELSLQARKRAARFTWEASAQAHVAAYERALRS